VTIDAAALLKQWGPKPAKTLIEAVEQKRDRKLLCLVYNEAPPAPTALASPLLDPFVKILRRIGKQEKLDLLLRTTGGMAEIPWRLVCLLREFTDHLAVIVPSFAYSGGTHIAIAADELVLTPFSALGSVDPMRSHPLLPQDPKGTGNTIPVSVQDLKHCIEFVRTQLGESYPSQNLALIVSELFKYINPLALGALEQAYSLSRLITRKVLGTRKQPLSEDHIAKIEKALAGEYFSHAFPISRAEVETDLKLPVTKPDTELQDRLLALEEHFVAEFARRQPLGQTGLQAQPAGVVPQALTFGTGGYLQTASCGFAIGQVLQGQQVLIDPWLEIPAN
jgi:hypothetical protein